jgi:hypothetical protein
MSEHSRSIDTRHHAIRQDYVDGEMRIGGVTSQDNESDILTKYLQPPLHEKHTIASHIKQTKRTTTLTNCASKLTLNGSLIGDQERHEQVTPPHCHCTVIQQTLDDSTLQPGPPRHSVLLLHAHQCRTEVFSSVLPEVLLENHVKHVFRRTRRNPGHRQLKVVQKIAHHHHILMRGPPPNSPPNTRRDPPTHQGRHVNPAIPAIPPSFLDLIYPPPHPQRKQLTAPPPVL